MSTSPVLEVAWLEITPGSEAVFEAAIVQAFVYLQQTDGYRQHQLQRCLEHPQHYLLLIQWGSLEAHLVNFRQSENFVQWRALIGPYFAQPPQVLHYQLLTRSP
ncbi:antibiotic biosynthesis monooxygenase [Synechococcus sp. Nb3U1]|uniref:antibiotic biosynthesis monooxygenase family protein n=1 Tax=Synechococcus sp. Nb3U1 TaxID=1914529 RepID=UPI001F328500|nr:antibiotic biosynthesis monooxygenase [Synechococcus sp. Nb3U1]MCF2969850.1 antibiotic biosynthesis monooxygenase [Synechococcus sp. Nb3U1]